MSSCLVRLHGVVALYRHYAPGAQHIRLRSWFSFRVFPLVSDLPAEAEEHPVSPSFSFPAAPNMDGGRKYPERTHAYTGRTCKLHTERPRVGVEPGTLCCEATVRTTVQPCYLHENPSSWDKKLPVYNNMLYPPYQQ